VSPTQGMTAVSPTLGTSFWSATPVTAAASSAAPSCCLLGEPQHRQVRPDFRDEFDFLFLRTNTRCGPSPQGPWILTPPGKKVSGISRGFARACHTVRAGSFRTFDHPPRSGFFGLLSRFGAFRSHQVCNARVGLRRLLCKSRLRPCHCRPAE
jgi:hypothetical protein